MKSMRLVEFGKPLELRDLDVPEPSGPQVLVKVRGAGVCHSVLHFVEGRFGRIVVKDLGLRIPVTPGHEISGEVVEVGEQVRGFKKGDRVAVDPWEGDLTCYYCRMGEEHLCENPVKLGESVDGGFAEFVLVPNYRYLFKLNRLDPVEASPLPCAGLTPYRAIVKRAQVKPSESVVILGAGGGLGTMAVQIAKAAGATVIGVDVREEALREAERAGADHVVDGRREDAVQEIKQLTESRGANVVVDTVGSKSTLQFIDALDKLGRYVILGLYGGDLSYHAPYITQREIQIIGSVVGNPDDFIGVMKLAESGRIRPLITKVMRLEEANEALENLRQAKVTARQVLVP
jgi:propanol-preferring alcohol dehydrogenase